MTTLTLAAILAGTNARALEVLPDGAVAETTFTPAQLQRAATGVSIDSRTVQDGELFVALPGEKQDGHEFAGAALTSGALACLVSRVPSPGSLRWPGDPPAALARRYLLLATNSLQALQHLATYWRQRQHAAVVAVTGSIGKTTTKEITAAVLSAYGGVLKSTANHNTEIGLPLTLLRLDSRHSAAVLEMGMYQLGDIALLAAIARPDIGIVTNVGPIHLERMGSIERIARAKSELVEALAPEALAILNGDDPWTRAMAEVSGVAPSVLVGLGERCHYRALDIQSRGLDGISFSVRAEGGAYHFETGVPGMHNVYAFLSAIATARRLDISWPDIQSAVRATRLEARQRVLQGPEGMLIIDDSYNAAPLSVSAALELLAASPGRKVAVLGDMLELGDEEEAAHRQVGARAAQVADWLVVRGERSSWIAEEALKRGLDPQRILRPATNVEAAVLIREIATTGNGDRWSVLVKGSRGMRMEEVVEALRGG